MRRRAHSGFTLLEIMLAVTILAIVVTAVYGIWSVSLHAWRRGEDAAAMFQRQRIVLEGLNELTKSAVYFGSDPSTYRLFGRHDETEGDLISFVTASDALLPPSEMAIAGMRRVTIWLAKDQLDRPLLAVANTPALEIDDAPHPPPHVFSTDVSGFSVRYWRASTSEWRDDWQEENTMPDAVEFTVTFGGTGGRNPPVAITRAVEFPIAQYANLHRNLTGNQNSGTLTSSGSTPAQPGGGSSPVTTLPRRGGPALRPIP
jgi:general secretion pathway protein J